jgi:AAA domain
VRHRHRRFGPGPYLTGLHKDPERWGAGFPYDVPAVDAVDTLDLSGPITLLAGDNDTGKSTIVEAIAEAMGFAAEGGELERSGELPAVPRTVMRDALEPVLTHTKPHNGYFLRAESFFNIAAFVDGGGIDAPDLAHYGDVPLHEQSPRPVVPRPRRQPLRRGEPVPARRAGGRSVGERRARAARHRGGGGTRRLAVRDRHALADPARAPGGGGGLDAPDRFIRATLGDADRE